ncbi:MAG: hypothetical protein ACRYGP_29335 [Janthinobacterium lividum]
MTPTHSIAVVDSLAIPYDDGRTANRHRRWITASVVALCCDGAESAILASTAWLASFVLLGFVHCVFAPDGGGSNPPSTVRASGSAHPSLHPVSTHEVSK